MKRVYVVMRNIGEGDMLERIFDSYDAAEAFVQKQMYTWQYDFYSYDVDTLKDIEQE